MGMNDDLDSKTDAELNELFAVEVAELEKCDAWLPAFHWSTGFQKGHCDHVNCTPRQLWPRQYCTKADLVLPWLEKAGYCAEYFGGNGNTVVFIDGPPKSRAGNAKGFARAAVLALIRMHRAKKEAR